MSEVSLRWKDDGGAFGTAITQEISEQVDFIYAEPVGQFRTRQYEIRYQGDTPLAIIAMEEEVVLLGY